MKTNRSYALAAEYRQVNLYSKLFLIAAIIALLLAAMPVKAVLAAPASDTAPIDPYRNLPREWSNKLDHLKTAGLFYNQVRLYPADFEDADDLSRAYFYLHNYGFALQQANTVVLNHAGFDSRGRVTNETQALQSVRDLAMYLHIMRGMRMKLEEQDFEYHLLK